MKKIKVTSHLLYLFFRAITFLIPLAATYFILFRFEGMLSWGMWSQIISLAPIKTAVHFSFLHRLVILLINFIPLSITVLICNNLARLFRLYERGELFEDANIKLIKGISIYMIVGQFIELLYQPLLSFALTFHNPQGEHMAALSFGTANITTLIIACIILVASWIVKEAHHLKSESQLTI